MKRLINLLLLSPLLGCSIETESQNPLILWYDEPAKEWVEALPVGNGRLGGMIYGGTENEHIQVNEETLWTGQPHDYAHEGAYRYLNTLRQLLWDGKQDDAHNLGNKQFMSQPFGQFCYQPFCDINFESTLGSPHSGTEVSTNGDQIILNGISNNYPKELDRAGDSYPESKIRFEARLKVLQNDGEADSRGSSIQIKNATNVTLALVGATSFVNYKDISADPSKRCTDYLDLIDGESIRSIRDKHVKDYQSLYKRLSIDLGRSEISDRPTDERLNTFYKDEDPNLVALLYQYGRYLLISSS